MAMDIWGNTIIAWVQFDGVTNSVFARRFSEDGFSPVVQVENLSTSASTTIGNLAVAVKDGRSSIVWVQSGESNSLYYAEMTDDWVSTGATLLESSSQAVTKPSVVISNSGPVVVWRQSDGTAQSLYGNFFQDWMGAWYGATLLESSSTAINDPIVRVDGGGTAWVVWRAGGDVFARAMSDGTLMPPIVLDSRSETVGSVSFALDSYTGYGVVAWTQSNGSAVSVYASR
jgi:hypothetical protein